MPTLPHEPRRHLTALNERWGITNPDPGAFDKFRNRFLYLASTIFDWQVFGHDGTESNFRVWQGHGSGRLTSNHYLQTASSFSQFMVVLQQFLWAMEESDSEGFDLILDALVEAKQYSPGIEFGVIRRKGSVTFYPQGARELDVALVEEPLEWLVQHPKVAETFGQALKTVLAKDADNYRSALDNLRWSLEQLLRAVLHNRKPLEKQRDVLLPWLKERDVHQQAINMYVDLLRRFTDYQNDAVKHGDNWQPAELELMIYSTGALMRFLIQANDSSPAS